MLLEQDDSMLQQPVRRGPGRVLLDGIVRMSSTRTNYWGEVALDLILGMALFFQGWKHQSGSVTTGVVALLLGLFVFSFVEYFFHRWMFHTRVPLLEQGHRMHHAQPLGYDSLPFFLPSAVLLILTGLFALILPTAFALLMMSAVTFGYIMYGLSHFAIHHVRFTHPWLRRWAGSHHVHHYHPETNFGLTSPLWDVLLGTRYVRQARKP